MTTDPELTALRQIGWDLWDPIGIRAMSGEAWKGAAANEYDSYLLRAASSLRDGKTLEEVATYLDQIVEFDMELGSATADSRLKSLKTAAKIAVMIRP